MVWHDAQGLAASGGESGGLDGLLEASADAMRAGAASAFGEHEVADATVARVDHWSLLVSVRDPGVERGERSGVEWDHAFGSEFADRDFEPGAVLAEGDEAVEFEVQQFADAHAGCSQDDDPGPGEVVVEVVDGRHQVTVDVGRESPWEGFG